jgi:hypothetical protein
MFRFSIRDVLWLTVVAGLAIGWWVDSGRIEKATSRLAKEAKLQREASDDELEVIRDYRKRYEEFTHQRIPDMPRPKPRQISPGE